MSGVVERQMRAPALLAGEPLLHVENLTVRFRTKEGVVTAIEDVSVKLMPGKTLCIVGESGSGKSVTALSILRLIPSDVAEIASGTVWFNGVNLAGLRERDLRKVRGKDIGMIFQEPMTSLNPISKIGAQIEESLLIHMGITRKQATERAESLLDLVGISQPRKRLQQYPHELSGGMRQRVMIAMALACDPKLLIADEPTTALDVTTQSQIMSLLRSLQEKLGLSIVMITHDLGLVAEFGDDVQVMYAGRTVETAPVSSIFHSPRHPYTKGLLRSVADLEGECERLSSIEGVVPAPNELPPGCIFAPRCSFTEKNCTSARPTLEQVDRDTFVACVKPFGVQGGTEVS